MLDLHDLRTRSSGHRTFIRVHIEVGGNLTLCSAHLSPTRSRPRGGRPIPAPMLSSAKTPHGIEEEHSRFG